MVRALILYFLSIKPTHGYDIQRFIEINGMDQWAKIKSGSIYYALNKLEQQGFIYTLREERNGARIRKIYAINEKGKEELKRVLKGELLKPIMGIESEKSLIYMMFSALTKDEIIENVQKHINMLKEKKSWWEKGEELKIREVSLEIEKLHFQMSISNLEYQIKWHELLIKDVDKLIEYSNGINRIIGKVDFGNLEEVKYGERDDLSSLEDITDSIIRDPTNLEYKVSKLIEVLKNN